MSKAEGRSVFPTEEDRRNIKHAKKVLKRGRKALKRSRREFDTDAEDRVATATATAGRTLLASTAAPDKNPIPTVGRIVWYRLSAGDVQEITESRGQEPRTEFGATPTSGDIVPLIVVRVWPNEYQGAAVVLHGANGQKISSAPLAHGTPLLSSVGVNGHAILDGTDTLWVTSAPQADANGCWNWPERV